ncbi:MAG: hypothetical protein V7K27_00190 [Nostoc sp.]|uniref:hypothetical protein n=1 Tax=Nostoc sp. TaxID=1180 RepID=UPI002FFAF922
MKEEERSQPYERQTPIPPNRNLLWTFAGGGIRPLYLAMALENLASQAWDEVDAVYPNL